LENGDLTDKNQDFHGIYHGIYRFMDKLTELTWYTHHGGASTCHQLEESSSSFPTPTVSQSVLRFLDLNDFTDKHRDMSILIELID
jgi:hypothetical protein